MWTCEEFYDFLSLSTSYRYYLFPVSSHPKMPQQGHNAGPDQPFRIVFGNFGVFIKKKNGGGGGGR